MLNDVNSDSLRIDQELHEKSNAMIAPCHEKLRELESMHHSKVLEVSDCAETSLKNDYLVRKLNLVCWVLFLIGLIGHYSNMSE